MNFEDVYGEQGMLKISMFPHSEAIWIGDVNKPLLLLREQITELLPYLTEYSETGNLTIGNKVFTKYSKKPTIKNEEPSDDE